MFMVAGDTTGVQRLERKKVKAEETLCVWFMEGLLFASFSSVFLLSFSPLPPYTLMW